MKLVVTPSDGKVRVSMTKPEIENNENKRQGPGYEVALEVAVPREVQIRVNQAVGSIRLTDLKGSVEASAKVGSIQATDVSGRVALNADVGSIEFIAPKDFSAKVQAKANIGSIQSDLPSGGCEAARRRDGQQRLRHDWWGRGGAFPQDQRRLDPNPSAGRRAEAGRAEPARAQAQTSSPGSKAEPEGEF